MTSNRLVADTLNLIRHFFCHYRSGVMGLDETKGNWLDYRRPR
jgi:hypothetical protein